MAPIDVGGYGIPATPHRFVAGPYHRNSAGNLAMFAFYRGRPDAAARTLVAWRVDYVLACPGMPGAATPGTMVAALHGETLGARVIARPSPGVTILGVGR